VPADVLPAPSAGANINSNDLPALNEVFGSASPSPKPH
jgi:hypothetical protein